SPRNGNLRLWRVKDGSVKGSAETRSNVWPADFGASFRCSVRSAEDCGQEVRVTPECCVLRVPGTGSEDRENERGTLRCRPASESLRSPSRDSGPSPGKPCQDTCAWRRG